MAFNLFKMITYLRGRGDDEARKRRLNEELQNRKRRSVFLDEQSRRRKTRASKFAVHSNHHPVQKLKLDFTGMGLLAYRFSGFKKGRR